MTPAFAAQIASSSTVVPVSGNDMDVLRNTGVVEQEGEMLLDVLSRRIRRVDQAIRSWAVMGGRYGENRRRGGLPLPLGGRLQNDPFCRRYGTDSEGRSRLWGEQRVARSGERRTGNEVESLARSFLMERGVQLLVFH